jgi:hypothetical protein
MCQNAGMPVKMIKNLNTKSQLLLEEVSMRFAHANSNPNVPSGLSQNKDNSLIPSQKLFPYLKHVVMEYGIVESSHRHWIGKRGLVHISHQFVHEPQDLS